MCFWCYILNKYPKNFGDEKWDFTELSQNKSLCFNCIKENYDDDWDVSLISKCMDLPWDSICQNKQGKFCVIFDNFELVLDEKSLVENVNVPLEFIKNHPNGLNGNAWSNRLISINKNITMDILDNNPFGLLSKAWNMTTLSQNKCLTADFIERNLEGLNNNHWDDYFLVRNKNLPWEFFEKYPKGINGKSWDISVLSTKVPLNFLENNPTSFFGEKWCIFGLVRNNNLSLDFIEKIIRSRHDHSIGKYVYCTRIDFPWEVIQCDNYLLDLGGISNNPLLFDNLGSIPPDIGKNLNIEIISSNKSLEWEFVETHKDGLFNKKWDISELSSQKWKIDSAKIRFKKVKPISQS